MRFSILLPTRNGGKFLADCIRSVLGERRDDVELVVSDNANTDETPAVLRSFSSDARLKVIRNETPVGVTDNWNRALAAGTGEYLLMLGDDDFVLPGYFDKVDRVLRDAGNPDCLTYNGFTFVFPGSIRGESVAWFGHPHFRFGPEFRNGGTLSTAFREELVKDMFRFRIRFPLNMQLTLVARRAAERIAGGMFQPPFPDHYALNALLLTAATWTYLTESIIVIGVSPKSFGHFVYSGKGMEGRAYLGLSESFEGQLAGSELLNSMWIWLNQLKSAYPERLCDVKNNRADYVRRQVFQWVRDFTTDALSPRDFVHRVVGLSMRDSLALPGAVLDPFFWRYLTRFLRPGQRRVQKMWTGLRPLQGIQGVTEFAAWLSQSGLYAQ